MKKKTTYLAITLWSVVLIGATPLSSFGGDLDDGISKFTDESIAKDDELGQPDKNIKYIITKAKSQAAAGQSSSDGSGNMNSVVVGPGSNVRGDVIILDQSKGDKTHVVE